MHAAANRSEWRRAYTLALVSNECGSRQRARVSSNQCTVAQTLGLLSSELQEQYGVDRTKPLIGEFESISNDTKGFSPYSEERRRHWLSILGDR